MKIRLLVALLAAFLLLKGESSVLAVDTSIRVAPDKAYYHPGEAVTLTLTASASVSAQATIRALDQTVATLSAPIQNGTASLTWTPPAQSLRGYGVDVQALDADGKTLASGSTAFDVLDDWIQAPRYGFLTNFSPGRSDADATMALDASFHVNGLQFYDWQYRHETLLPPAGMEPYTDILGRVHSLVTVNRLIEAAHDHNIAAMPYTAIYGASYAFYDQHPDWALFALGDQPYDFGGFLKIMDPTPGSSWANHLLGEYASVLNNTAFDGIHIDQYGAPTRGRNAAGQEVDLSSAFPGFIDQTAALVHQLRGADDATIFNLVRDWPVQTVAPSDESVTYIEVWEPYRYFMDLARLVAQAQTLGKGKPVIIAAYISPSNVANVRLANALIFASGGYHLELGEPRAMLADAYFPRYGVMSDAMMETERRYYDFLVRYENVLALGTTDATQSRAPALTIDGVKTDGSESQDRVVVIVRQGQTFETFSLINLLGIDDPHWDVPLTDSPTPLSDLTVHVGVTKPVARVWLASPDGADPSAQAVAFTTSPDGTSIQLSVPQLDFWTMLVLEYQT